MPYIKHSDRLKLDRLLEQLASQIESRGELNYCITALLCSQTKLTGYAALEQGLGTLEAAKLEFYRRVVAPYEDEKLASNGDVYFAEDIVKQDIRKDK